ncbi:MAG: MFS transporter [Kiritimatiellae bacterium]|nr:MFS transporter [Kiritimatiellia bacterium]
MSFLRTHLRWGVVALLFFTALLNNLDRMVLSVLAPTLKESLAFGDVEYSYVVAAFLAAYALGYTFCGKVLDRVGVKLGMMAALVFWSVAAMGHAAAVGWLSLAAFRFLLGLGESFNSPGGVKAIAEWIPRRERGLCMAVFSNGNVLGSIIAPPLVAFLSLHLGWRWAFGITGGLGLVLWAVWRHVYHSPENHPRLTEEERAVIMAERGERASWFVVRGSCGAKAQGEKRGSWFVVREELKHKDLRESNQPTTRTTNHEPRTTLITCAGFFVARLLTDPIVYFFTFWLFSYLKTERHFTLAMIGAVGWIPFLASDIGGPGGGALSDWLVRRGWHPRRARLALMLLAACAMPVSIVAVLTPNAWLSIACIALILGSQSCWMANQLTLISESVPRTHAASLLALSALGGSIGGIAANLLAGRAIHAAGYVPVFCVLGFCHLTAFAVLVLTGRKGVRHA